MNESNSGGRRQTPLWLLVAALGVFLLYAANFFYAFTDDEGIPFIYAQHLLRGHGLVYTSVADGRVEGYSDYLHVLFSTGILWTVEALKWPRISVFFIGKAFGMLAGAGTIAIVFIVLRKTRVPLAAAAAGLGFLVLAGPFALWSSSSLETAPFAFLLAALMAGLMYGVYGSPRGDLVAAVAASLLILERIDGPIYVAAMVGAFLLCAPRPRQFALLGRVVLPVLAVAVAYHGWRFWYFGELLPTPLVSKVWFKLHPNPQLVTKLPPQSYAARFAAIYGTAAVAVAIAAAVYGFWREPRLRPLVLAGAAMTAYVAVVGDWMYGFRFFVPIIPAMAVILAWSVALLVRQSAMSWLATAVIVGWCVVSAAGFERQFETISASWLKAPSLEPMKFFGRYADILEASRLHIPERSLAAYNQAGFIPFMLDLRNIDNLGICNAFYARMPTTDLYFTEVGRYGPLSEVPSLRAGEAYLLYRDVPFVIAGENSGKAPDMLMGGYYERVAVAHGEGIYKRTSRSSDAFRRDPTLFRENLAHVSSLRNVRLNGRALTGDQLEDALPFLRNEYNWIPLDNGTLVLEADFADTDEPVYSIDVNGISSKAPASITIELLSTAGEKQQTQFAIAGGPGIETFYEAVNGVSARHLRMTIRAATDAVWLKDLRIQGQSSRLASFVRNTLRFLPSAH